MVLIGGSDPSDRHKRGFFDPIRDHLAAVGVAVLAYRDFMVPRCAFSIYTYSDPGDPKVVAIDTVTCDVIGPDGVQVGPTSGCTSASARRP